MVTLMHFSFNAILALIVFTASPSSNSSREPGDKIVTSLKDFRDQELKSAGFTLAKETRVHVHALGGGEKRTWENWFGDDEPQLYAGGWIIDATTREAVWEMDFENTSGRDGRREFDGTITLLKGSYEVYFAAYAFQNRNGLSKYSMNIDRRRERTGRRSFGSGLLSFLGLGSEDRYDDFMELAKEWEITVSVEEANSSGVTTFEAPKTTVQPVLSAYGVNDEQVVRKTLKVAGDLAVYVRAIGEGRKGDGMFDYGWIVNSDTRERVWEMTLRNTKGAGGALKNREFKGDVKLSKGTYELVYITDGSHSPEDWNAMPPHDPYHYGIALFAKNETDRNVLTVSDYAENEKNIIVQVTKVRESDLARAGFNLSKDTKVRIYAIGEWDNEDEPADYGWIVNTKTRERAWRMDRSDLVHAGGDQKNRMVDVIITLPKGNYMAYYQTDGSHSYNDWNSDPPFDEDHWGLTVYGVGEGFDPKSASAFKEEEEENVISQIIKVRDGRHERKIFKIDRATKVRIYALGEAMDRDMYDYGWIEDAASSKVVWEMTFRMTEHAGGAEKNRLVSTVITLQPGEYELHYETDGSHAFNDWNDDPPEDRIHWGITVYKE
jgi:hypothetical protein